MRIADDLDLDRDISAAEIYELEASRLGGDDGDGAIAIVYEAIAEIRRSRVDEVLEARWIESR